MAIIVNKVQDLAKFTGEFADLVPLVATYLGQRCFDEPIDLESEPVRIFLGQPTIQDKVARFLAKELADLTSGPSRWQWR